VKAASTSEMKGDVLFVIVAFASIMLIGIVWIMLTGEEEQRQRERRIERDLDMRRRR
jgi:hypothetical protein